MSAKSNYIRQSWFERHEISGSHSIIGIKGSISRGTGYINSVSLVLWSENPTTEEERIVMMKKITDFNRCTQCVRRLCDRCDRCEILINIASPVCLLIFTIIALLKGIPEYNESKGDIYRFAFIMFGIVGRFGVVGYSSVPLIIPKSPDLPYVLILIYHCLCILVMVLCCSFPSISSMDNTFIWGIVWIILGFFSMIAVPVLLLNLISIFYSRYCNQTR